MIVKAFNSKYPHTRCKKCGLPVNLGSKIIRCNDSRGKGRSYHPKCWDDQRDFDSYYTGTLPSGEYLIQGEPEPSEDNETPLPEPNPFTPPKDDVYMPVDTPKPTPIPEPIPSPSEATTAIQALANVMLGPLASKIQSLENLDAKVDQAVSAAMSALNVQSIDETRVIDLVRKHSVKESRIEFVTPDTTRKLEGLVHKDVPTIAEMLLVAQNVYIYGAAGAGKTFMARQIADLLGLEFHPFQISKMSPQSVLKGFIDGNGGKQEQRFINAVQRPSLIFFDEFDRWPSHITTFLNGFLANGYIDARGHEHPISRHSESYVLMAGNTSMRGRDEYFPEAVAQEFPTMDRAKFFHVEYDQNLEQGVALSINPNCTPWIQWVQGIRPEAMSGKHGKVFATPRATYDGAKLLGYTDLSATLVADACVFKGLDKSTREKLLTQFPLASLDSCRKTMRVKVTPKSEMEVTAA